MKRLSSLLMIFLIITLPFATALEISNVGTESITPTSVDVVWDTDEPGSSFVSYGTNPDDLETVGNRLEVEEHRVTVQGLEPNETYHFRVRSNDVHDTNDDALYTFTTLPPDETPPELTVDLPEKVRSDRISVEGSAEPGSSVEVFVNDALQGSVTAGNDGTFSLHGVALQRAASNLVRVTATDGAGNVNTVEVSVSTDLEPPVLTVDGLEDGKIFADVKKYTLEGTVSEESSITIFVDDQSVAELVDTRFAEEIRLEEGDNNVTVQVVDPAGWDVKETFVITADTRAPAVQFTLVNGKEYYEGRAETDIVGDTEANAEVYLYVFRQNLQSRLDFSRAQAKTTADGNGTFRFKDVEFPPSTFASLQQLKPTQVPAGLQELVTVPSQRLQDDERVRYSVYVIAEDPSGKTSFDKESVQINSCSSGEFAFDLEELHQFRAPFRLNPGYIEEGRETIQAVFNLTYKKNAVGIIDTRTGLYTEPYEIVGRPQFMKACTQETAESDEYKLGCELLPATRLDVQTNADRTAFYVTATLRQGSEFLDRGDDIWDDYVGKRRLKFPIRALISYKERQPDGSWSPSKTQSFCSELAYFVDVPIRSEELVPDFLADEGVDALNYTINKIEQVKPYLETAMLTTGVGCVGSFLTKLVTRIYRNFISNFEHWSHQGITAKDKKTCPKPQEQDDLLMGDTIDNWDKMKNRWSGNGEHLAPDSEFPNKKKLNKADALKEHCPQTAHAWEIEATFDKAYRWLCDRFLCRSVPAGWTAEATKDQVDHVINQQQMCSATANCGNWLRPQRNCQKDIQLNLHAVDSPYVAKDQGELSCWRDEKGVNYLPCTENLNHPACGDNVEELLKKGMQKLYAIPNGQPIEKPSILALDTGNPEQLCVAAARDCDTQCRIQGKGKYKAASDGFTRKGGKGGCYIESDSGSRVELWGQVPENGRAGMDSTKTQAGYTKDCFIDEIEQERYQCVCEKIDIGEIANPLSSARVATKSLGAEAEEWFYRQDRIYSETGGRKGTKYPAWRYYEGRDFSGAFGADYLLDSFQPDISRKSTAKVDPHNQYLGSLQSMCLTTINANLNMLQSTLIGMQKCIVQAKHEGVVDAGLCKQLFSQYVCGLVYKGISYLGNQCSPLSIKDVGKGEDRESGIRAFFDSAAKAVPRAVDASISEIQSDYGNAQFQQFFKAGSQGFAESMCLAAFGYDFPMGMDFIRDAAYAVSTKVDVIFPIAERELLTYDPVKGTAVHSYNLGGVLFPGCKIRGYRTELKCIGFDELNNPGVDCSQQKCDCVNAQTYQPQFSNERTHRIDGGSNFGSVVKNQMLDLPIPSPQRISSNYRYDHVVFNVFLDPLEDPDNCFDEQFQTGNGGKFYFPIQDVSAPGQISCFVRPETGKFACPKVSELFGGGQTYFEFPYMQCYDDTTDSFVDCDQLNLYIVGEEMIIKPYINIGNEPACLVIEDTRGHLNILPQPLPEGTSGLYAPEIRLGTVKPDMIYGSGIGSLRSTHGNPVGCGVGGEPNTVGYPNAGAGTSQSVSFTFTESNPNQFTLEAQGVSSVQPTAHEDRSGDTYGRDSGTGLVTVNGGTTLTREQMNKATFRAGGFTFHNVIGSATPDRGNSGTCGYEARPTRGSSAASRLSGLSVTASLYQRNEGESCWNPKILVQRTNQGENRVKKNIRIQAEYIEEAYASDMGSDFERGNYPAVIQKASQVVAQGRSTLGDAIAMYYYVLSLAMTDVVGSESQIRQLVDGFFTRDYRSDVTTQRQFQQILTYFCELDRQKYGNKYADRCQGWTSVSAGATGDTCEIDANYRDTHVCMDVGSYNGDASKGCKTGLCESKASNVKCCQVKTQCEVKPAYAGRTCQDTATRAGGKNGCDPGLCQNEALKHQQVLGGSNPDNWQCCTS